MADHASWWQLRAATQTAPASCTLSSAGCPWCCTYDVRWGVVLTRLCMRCLRSSGGAVLLPGLQCQGRGCGTCPKACKQPAGMSAATLVTTHARILPLHPLAAQGQGYVLAPLNPRPTLPLDCQAQLHFSLRHGVLALDGVLHAPMPPAPLPRQQQQHAGDAAW